MGYKVSTIPTTLLSKKCPEMMSNSVHEHWQFIVTKIVETLSVGFLMNILKNWSLYTFRDNFSDNYKYWLHYIIIHKSSYIIQQYKLYDKCIFLIILKAICLLMRKCSSGVSWNCFSMTKLSVWVGGLVVKMLTCYIEGPGFNPRMENPKFSRDLHQQIPSWMSLGYHIWWSLVPVSMLGN